MLKGMGFTITFAQSGSEALEMVFRDPPSLVLLDISMPGMDGFEVCEKIKDNPATRDIPVIFVTARDNPADIVRGFATGAVDYITRPVNSAELKARVITHLDLKASRNLIEQQNRELREMNASKDKFLSILAHDLKNPITGLITISELTLKMYDALEKSEILSYIQEIHSSSERVLHILEDLLQWSRSQTGRIHYKPEEIRLHRITTEVVAYMERNAKQKEIVLENNVAPELTAYADRYMVSTIIRNLLSNAVKFTYPGGKVTLHTEEKPTYVQVNVTDSGVGLDTDQMKKLFRIDGGLSTPGTKNEKGTGLGLILCKEFIEKNKGTISVESVPRMGTTFSITLPRKNDIN